MSSSLLTLEHLDPEHLDAATRAIHNLVSSEIAESTFSQIVDGMPTFMSYVEFHDPPDDHPINDHETLCPGALEKTRELRAGFEPLTLSFNSCAVQAFQDSEAGSNEFELRLFELVAIACHQIAVQLYQLDDGVHKHQEHETWQAEAVSRLPKDRPYAGRLLPPATAFWHWHYKASHQYPNGIADVVGYWAEAKIFGGVVVFDRGETETEAKRVFLHASRYSGPRTLYPPTESQHRELMKFLLSEPGTDPCPLPLLDSMDNRPRYEAYDAFAYFHVFRDRYERVLPPERRIKDVCSTQDFPEIADRRYIIEKHWARATGESIDEAELAAAEERLRNITPSSPCWTGPVPWNGTQSIR
ncbi:Uu.00g033860.m01.CDS01 [Anthostomella pinea]|uniref:Uu.00g033860.m01.CDS01 n=1 Tax=Anthostomella pinea TaxID=933095 RepID=A0AAI8V912_9PEZI|nr:Uu.00g033860.m01.CDS01 [Anthostomella pinea]